MGQHRPHQRTSATLPCPPITPCPICHLRQWLRRQPEPPPWLALLQRQCNINNPMKAWWAMAVSTDMRIAWTRVPNSLETQNQKMRNGGGKFGKYKIYVCNLKNSSNWSSEGRSALFSLNANKLWWISLLFVSGCVALNSAFVYSKKKDIQPHQWWSQCGAVWFEYKCCQFSDNKVKKKKKKTRKFTGKNKDIKT